MSLLISQTSGTWGPCPSRAGKRILDCAPSPYLLSQTHETAILFKHPRPQPDRRAQAEWGYQDHQSLWVTVLKVQRWLTVDSSKVTYHTHIRELMLNFGLRKLQELIFQHCIRALLCRVKAVDIQMLNYDQKWHIWCCLWSLHLCAGINLVFNCTVPLCFCPELSLHPALRWDVCVGFL